MYTRELPQPLILDGTGWGHTLSSFVVCMLMNVDPRNFPCLLLAVASIGAAVQRSFMTSASMGVVAGLNFPARAVP